MISVIVPVLNEKKALEKRRDYFQGLAEKTELIFADGGSIDRSADICREWGKVVSAPKGRASQMNAGAREAAGEILLFLHADCYLEKAALDSIVRAVRERGITGGCLRQVIDRPGLMYRWIAWTGNVRARVSGIFYGDQGIFVRKDVFAAIGGFPEVPLCEDVFFSRELKRRGKTAVLNAPVFASSRRWEEQGFFRTFWLNARISLRLLLNRDPADFAKIYTDIR